MAVEKEEEAFTEGRTMRKIVGNRPKLLVDQKVEVRSSEEGFLGSWHSGTVIACENTIRLVHYDNLLSDNNNSKNLFHRVKTSEMIDSIISTNSTPSNYRGWIRPLPPPLDWNTLWLHYGQCVDVFHKDAWWEGVVFDHEDGSLERIIFFPDMGDELKAHKNDLRITQDWNESNEVWKPRGDWFFLELIEEIEKDWPLLISVKQIWYDMQLKIGFQNLKEWTSSLRDIWKELVLQVVVDNFKLSITEFFHKLNSSENLLVELNEPVLDSLLMNKAYFGDFLGAVPCELSGQSRRDELLPADIKKVCCRRVEEEEIGRVKNELSWDSYCNNYKGSFSTNCKVPTLRKRHTWFPAGPDIVPKAEFCVDAINEYLKNKRSYDTALNVRKHLSFLGWKIEFTIKRGEQLFRYIEHGPNGKHFQSLVRVCEYLRESTSKPDELCPATNSKTRKHTWQPAGLDVVPEAKFCEDAIIEYYKKSKARHALSNDLKLKARKHLSFLGWKMEYLQEKELKWRYTRPSGVGRCFNSLLKVCEYLKKSASDIGSPIPQDDHSILIAAPGTSSSPLTEQSQGCKEELVRRSLFQLIVEPECCPEAIVNYYSRIWKRDDKLALKAKRHLSFVGWRFYYVYRADEVGHKREFRYSSPNGMLYYTLLAACKACIDEGISDNKAYDSEQRKIRHVSKDSERQLASDAQRSMSEKQPAASSGASLSSEAANVGKVEVQGIRKRGRKRKSISLNLVYSKEIQALKSKDNLNGAVTRVDKNAEGQAASNALCSPLVVEVHGTFVSQNPPSERQPLESSGISLSSEVADLGEVQGIKKRGRKRKCISLNHISQTSTPRNNDSKEGEVIKPRENLNGSVSTRVLRSSNRVSQVVVPSSSHSNPQTVLSWLIDSNVVLPRAKVQYCIRRGDRKMAEGRVTRDGIRCGCCQDIFTLRNFEAHAGSSYHQPSANIFLEDGTSLLECQLQLIRDIDARSSTIEQYEVKGNQQQYKNDDICSVCHFGGELVLCDQCPSSFHTLCLDLKEVPEGDWFCPSCCCKICGQSKINGDVEQFMDNSVINCHQCEHIYHIGCLRKKGLVVDSYPTGHWFCYRRCEQIFLGLQKILGKPVPVGVDNLTWTLLKYTKSDSCDNNASKIEGMSENYGKLNVALRVMHECFKPVKETRSGRDLVEDVIFNRRSGLNHLNYRGFYTVLLEKNDELISAATVRVYGEKVAEIPLVATRFLYRRRGMCRILMNELVKVLAELGVERLVLPAVSSLLDTWMSSFGFSIMTQSERYEFLDYNFLDFQGTVMCQKVLLKTPSIESAPLGASQQLCNDNDGNDNMDLDESSPASEVFQANQIADSGVADQKSY